MYKYNIDIAMVGGGGGGGSNCGAGGGGGGEVYTSHRGFDCEDGLYIYLGSGGIGGYCCCTPSCRPIRGYDGGYTCISYLGTPFAHAKGGGGGGVCGGRGISGNLHYGYCTGGYCAGGGGGGASCNGCSGSGVCKGGNGGAGLCGMGGGGGGGSCVCDACGGSGVDGGGNGTSGSNGCTGSCGGGGGGGGAISASICGGKGGNGVVKICYKADGTCGITAACGGTITTSGGYCIHTFTSDGAFYIPGSPAGWCGIYHNSNLGLITMSKGDGVWVTLRDKNLGATSTDVTSADSYGCYYQRGNNYGFPQSGFTKTSTRVDASLYGPGCYYCCCNFICTSNNCDWSTAVNNDLWGDMLNNGIVRRGPSPNGFHVPSFDDKCRMVMIMQGVLGRSVTTSDTANYLYMPPSGYLGYNNGTASCVGVDGRWRLSSYYAAGTYPNGLSYNTAAPNCSSSSNYNRRGTGYSVRPFKDIPVIPDSTWCKLV